jgi:hypothetical protein
MSHESGDGAMDQASAEYEYDGGRCRAASEFDEGSQLTPIACTCALVVFSVVLFGIGECIANFWSGSPQLRVLGDLRCLIFAYPLVVPLVCLVFLGQTSGAVAAVACLVYPELILTLASAWSPAPLMATLATFGGFKESTSIAPLVDRREVELFVQSAVNQFVASDNLASASVARLSASCSGLQAS